MPGAGFYKALQHSENAKDGIGEIFGPLGGFGNEVGRGMAHGVAQGGFSMMQGGGFLQGYASGMFGSLGGSAWQATPGGSSAAGTFVFSAFAGGLGAELSGGEFWQGASVGLLTAGLNHVAHTAEDNYRSKQILEASREFLVAEGYSYEEVCKDIVHQNDPEFRKNFAKFQNFKNYSHLFNDGYYDSYSKTHDAWRSKNIQNPTGKFLNDYALKYYPSRSNSVGIVRTGVMHYFEAGMAMFFNYDMHRTNSRSYLFESGMSF